MKIPQIVSELWSGQEFMVEMAMFTVQRVITPKAGKPELQFMCSAHHLMVLFNGLKLRENISKGLRVMEWTQNYDALTDGWTDTQNFGWYNIIPCHFLWPGIKKDYQRYTV